MSPSEESEDIARRKRAETTLASVKRRFSDVAYVEPGEIETLRAAQRRGERRLVVVDVREEEEVATSTLEGALRPADLEAALDEANTAELPTTAIIYCTIGFRSGMVARSVAARHPDVDVRNYSVLQHLWEGGSMTNDQVHMYSAQFAGMVPPGTDAVHYSAPAGVWRFLRFLLSPR